MTDAFLARLSARADRLGALCVGIDPHPGVLGAWGLEDDVHGLATVARTMVDALGDVVCCFKPQSAFFEAYGPRGVAVLAETIAAARAAGALVIVDAKRGDIGSTMAAYARAYLDDRSELAGDAVTISPYLGFGSLNPAFDAAEATGRGVYVLARTSNPEGHEVQLATGQDGRSVAQTIVDAARTRNAGSGAGAVGLVVGGTHTDLGVDLDGYNGSILVPGIGAQGGTMRGLSTLFGSAAGLVLPSASREVLLAGPDPESLRARVAALVAARD